MQLDYDSFYKSLREIFGGIKLPENIFEKMLYTVLEGVQVNKKSAEVLIEILTSPCNYLSISTQILIKFTKKVLLIEDSSALYKHCLAILSTLYSYKVQPFEVISAIEEEKNSKRALLLQAYSMANYTSLNAAAVREALKISSKQRKNIWAR